jgi:hypothetical protein
MTPKEKAKELVLKYQFYVTTWDCYNDEPLELKHRMPHMKECALIAVDEMLSFIEDDREGFNWKDYYKEVKQEIEKL